MNGYHFTSSLFDVEPGEDEEINPRMYGRQLAAWLRQQLEQRGHNIEYIVAEDWGSCIVSADEQFALWVGCGSSVDYDTAKPGDPPPPKETIVWYCFPEAELSFWQRFVKRLDTGPALAKLDGDLHNILTSEPNIQLVDEDGNAI